MINRILSTIIILVASYNISRAQEKSPAFYSLILKELKEAPIESSQVKNYVLEQLMFYKEESTDEEVHQQYQDYIDEVSAVTFYRYPARPLSDVPNDLLRGFDVKEDKFQKRMFVTPKRNIVTGYCIEPYLVLDNEGHVSARARIRYMGSDWVFMEKIKILLGEDVLEYEFKNNVQRNTRVGYVLESVDEPVNQELYTILAEIAGYDSKSSIRFEGEYYVDQNIPKAARNSVIDTLDLFDSLILE